MTFQNTPGLLTIVNEKAPAFAPRIEGVSEYEIKTTQHLDRIHSWVGPWQKDLNTSPISQLAYVNRSEIVTYATLPTVGRTEISGRPSWAFPDDAHAHISLPNLVIPESYTVYIPFRMDVADTVGLFGTSTASGERVMVRADFNGTLRADHGAVSEDLILAANRWDLGAPSIAWVSYDADTMLMSLGGTTSGVVDVSAASTKTLSRNHAGYTGVDVGNVANFFGTHTIGEFILCDGSMPLVDPSAHSDFITNLAGKYGLSVGV